MTTFIFVLVVYVHNLPVLNAAQQPFFISKLVSDLQTTEMPCCVLLTT